MLTATEAHARCCAEHSSLEELTGHLIADFSELDAAAVARQVAYAVAVTDFVGLDPADERLLLVELVARQQLELLSGRRAEAARLDPERHPSRRAAQ